MVCVWRFADLVDSVASLRKGVMLVERTGWPKSKAIADYFLKTPFGGVGRRSAGSEYVVYHCLLGLC